LLFIPKAKWFSVNKKIIEAKITPINQRQKYLWYNLLIASKVKQRNKIRRSAFARGYGGTSKNIYHAE
jgi:hypothetical protein